MENKTANNQKPYYIGLDIGTNSVGFCVTDEEYNIVRKQGKHLWGARLFASGGVDEKNQSTSIARRNKRRARRTINKRNWRLGLLKEELSALVSSEDPSFLTRIKQIKGVKEPLFIGEYSDSDYFSEFPTIYYLREALKDQNKVLDYLKRGIYYRLLFLACNDILKRRGHFLENNFNTQDIGTSFSEASIKEQFKKLIEKLESDDYPLHENSIWPDGSKDYALKQFEYKSSENPDFEVRKSHLAIGIIKSVFGLKSNLKDLFDLGEDFVVDFSSEENETQKELLTSYQDIFEDLESLYRRIKLSKILKDSKSISDSKIKIHKKHKCDLKKLKKAILNSDTNKDLYKKLFKHKFTPFYAERTNDDKVTTTNKERFTKFIDYVKTIDNDDIKNLLKDETFLEIPTNKENSMFPYQLHLKELEEILNVFNSLKLVNNTNTIKENILQLLKFKVPYYAGPLSNRFNGKNYWLKFKDSFNGKVTPYNFDEVVDKSATNEEFIRRMKRSCTYLNNEFAMQQETILYQTYIFYNTMNKVTVNGEGCYIEKDLLKTLFEYLVEKNKKTISDKVLQTVLGYHSSDDIKGIKSKKNADRDIEISLSAITRFRQIFPNTDLVSIEADFYDEVINQIGFIEKTESAEIKQKIKAIASKSVYSKIKINEEQLEQLSKLKSNRSGSLSKKFLSGIRDANDKTIMDYLKNEFLNLNEIYYKYNFKDEVDKENGEAELSISSSNDLNQYLKDRYIAPQVIRPVIQAMLVVKELRQIMGYDPNNIIIEFTRAEERGKQGKETQSRFKIIENAYKNFKNELNGIEELQKELSDIKSNSKDKMLSKKIYLYFLQVGKDIYTGKPIELSEVIQGDKYDVDHIIPKSAIPNDSVIGNLVLTDKAINNHKSDQFPIESQIQKERRSFWESLKKSGLMSKTKFESLTRTTAVTDAEINSFVNRQKTTTDWTNKEVAELLMKYFNKKAEDKFIIYSKARNVSEFRNEFKFIKIRDLNNRHHGEDAYLNTIIGLLVDRNLFGTTESGFNPKHGRNIKSLVCYKLAKKIDFLRQQIAIKDQLITKKLDIKTSGQFWKESVLSYQEGDTSLKQALKYHKKELGVMDDIKTAFFSVVKINDRGREKTSIIPVMTYECSKIMKENRLDEKLLKEYLPKSLYAGENNLNIVDVVLSCLPVNAKIIYDNKYRFRIAGRSAKTIVVHNQRELYIDFTKEELLVLKAIFKDDKKQLSVDELLLDSIYEKIFLKKEDYVSSVQSRFDEESKKKYNSFSNKEKSDSIKVILSSLLKANNSNQCSLFGKTVRSQSISSNITKNLIYIKESVTGFYQKEIPLYVSKKD